MTPTTQKDLSEELAERGWRTEIVTKPDGTVTYVKIRLTSEEFLANDPTTAVFRDASYRCRTAGSEVSRVIQFADTR